MIVTKYYPSLDACLRVAASAKAGGRIEVGVDLVCSPSPPPSTDRRGGSRYIFYVISLIT
jgi:hypothetical protein